MSVKQCVGLLCAAATIVLSSAAVAQGGADYPNRPVRWVVPFPPGASNDVTARIFAQKLAEHFGQQFVIDNRPGAGGTIGAAIVAEAEPNLRRGLAGGLRAFVEGMVLGSFVFSRRSTEPTSPIYKGKAKGGSRDQ